MAPAARLRPPQCRGCSTLRQPTGALYLDEPLLRELQQQAGIVPYTVLQALGDAVVVPAGCAHQVRLPRPRNATVRRWPPMHLPRSPQVRNLRSCISVSAGFVAPEHVSTCLRLTDERRYLPAAHPRRADGLDVRAVLFHAACACLSWFELLATLFDDTLPCAFLDRLRAEAAPSELRAPPEHREEPVVAPAARLRPPQR